MIKISIIYILVLILIIVISLNSSFNYKSNQSQIVPQGVPLPGDYTITAYFHDINYYNTFHEWHTGIDMIPSTIWIKNHNNEEVFLHSTISGTGYTYTEKCTGNAALVINSNYIIYLGHVKSFLFNNGDTISFGQKIAIMGESGELGKCITGPHVHYQIFKKIDNNFVIIDPITYLN